MEQAVHLLDASLVAFMFLHHPVQNGNIQRYNRDRRAGLGDKRLIDGNIPLYPGELIGDFLGGGM